MKISKLAIIFLIIFVLSMVHLTFNAQNIRLNYEVQTLKNKLNDIYSTNRLLSTQTAQKSALSRIDKIAREKLKMVYPEEMNYLVQKTVEAVSKPSN